MSTNLSRRTLAGLPLVGRFGVDRAARPSRVQPHGGALGPSVTHRKRFGHLAITLPRTNPSVKRSTPLTTLPTCLSAYEFAIDQYQRGEGAGVDDRFDREER